MMLTVAANLSSKMLMPWRGGISLEGKGKTLLSPSARMRLLMQIVGAPLPLQCLA